MYINITAIITIASIVIIIIALSYIYSTRTENSLHTTIDPNDCGLCCPAMKKEVPISCSCNLYKHSNNIS